MTQAATRDSTSDWREKGAQVSVDVPQYEIKSDKTDHIAFHKGEALRLADR
jgi:hypothetical protein